MNGTQPTQPNTSSRKYQDFYVQIPRFLVDWTDTSWFKDVTASSQKEGPNGNNLRVWVYPDDPDEREYPEQLKYFVILENEDGKEIAYIEANTDAECIEAIKGLERKNSTL